MSFSLLCEFSLGIKGVRGGSTEVDGEQGDSPLHRCRHWLLVLRDDDHGRGPDSQARVLIRGALDAPGDHQPDVHAVSHVVARQQLIDPAGQLRPGQSDPNGEGLRARIEAIQMCLQEYRMTGCDAKPLPHSVTHNETGVEHRDDRLCPGEQGAIYADQDVIVAQIVDVVVRPMGHSTTLALPSTAASVRTRKDRERSTL